jgi:hypothetical protein
MSFALFTPESAYADILFEGYYKIISSDRHVGYIIHRDAYNARTKLRTLTYLVWTKYNESVSQEAVQVVVRRSAKKRFIPVSFRHWEGLLELTSLTEGTFGEKLHVIRKDLRKNVTVNKGSLLVPPDGVFSSLALPMIAELRPAEFVAGHRIVLTAFSEESERYSDMAVNILKTVPVNGERVITAEIQYLNEATRFLLLTDGQTLGTRSNLTPLETYLVADRKEAIGNFPLPAKTVRLLFGYEPSGLTNPVATSGGRLSPDVILREMRGGNGSR